MTDLTGKAALVTGGGRGIGRATAIALARAGMNVAICSRTGQELEEAAATIAATNPRTQVLAQECDISDERQVAALLSRVRAQFGQLQVLVNCAAITAPPAPLAESDPDGWWRVLEVNVRGTYLVCRYSVPLLKLAAPGSRIVTIGAGAGRVPTPDITAYSLSKAALWMLTRCLAIELTEVGVDVNEILPGAVDTAIRAPGLPTGVDRLKPPEEIAELVLWLARMPERGPTAQTFSVMRRPIVS